MKLRKNTIKFENAYHRLVLVQFIGESTLIYPLYSIMFNERTGISAVGVGFLLATWQLTQIIVEVPTGIIADKFSKKYSIVLGRLLKALCFGIWFFFPSFGGYLVGFMVWGIGEAFISGAVQAYLYELDEGKKDSNYLKSFSRLKSLEMVAYTITYFCTFLIGPRYQLLVGLSVLGSLLAFSLSLTLPTSKTIPDLKIKDILHDSIKNLSGSVKLRWKFLEGLAIAGTLGMLIELIVVNYRDYGVESKYTSLLISISTLVSAATFWLLHRYEKFFSRNLLRLLFFCVIVFFIMYNMSMWWQVFGLFLVARYMRILAVIQESNIIESVNERSRATLLSAYSFISKLLSALQIFLVGFFAINDNINAATFWFVLGSLAVFIFLRIIDLYNLRKLAL